MKSEIFLKKRKLTLVKRLTFIFLILLCSLGLQAHENDKYRFRLYFGGAGNSAMSSMPLNAGVDYWWNLNKSFSVSAGLGYYAAFGMRETWQINQQDYYWNNFEDQLVTLTVSARYSIAVKELKNGSLLYFVEPGAIITPFPSLYIDDRKEDQSHLNGVRLKGDADWANFFWQVHSGLAYQLKERDNGIGIRYELSCSYSNMDYYKQYRKLMVGDVSINPFLPEQRNSLGLCLAVYLSF